MKILLGIDGSRSSQSVVQAVATRPWSLGAELRAISVADPLVNAELAPRRPAATALLLEECSPGLAESRFCHWRGSCDGLFAGLSPTSFADGSFAASQPPPRALMSWTAATICCIRKVTAVC